MTALDNRPAMDRFLASVERRAFKMAVVAVGKDEDALDIMQDAMFGFVKKYASRPESEWKPLFYRVLQNKIRDFYRRGAVRNRWRAWLGGSSRDKDENRSDPMESVADPDAPDPADEAAMSDSLAALEAALRALPMRQQQAFMLRAWEGLSVDETAGAMKCSAGSVKTHYSRAVHSLRERLEDHWP